MELGINLGVCSTKIVLPVKKIVNLEYIIFGVYIVLSTIVLPYLNLGFVTTKILVPVLLISYLVRIRKLTLNRSFIFFILFFIWSIFSSFFAKDLAQVIFTESRFFITALQCFILFLFVNKSKDKLIFALRLVSLCSLLYTALLFYYGSIFLFSGDIFRLDPEENELLSNELLSDTNNFGYFCYSGLSALALLYFLTRSSWHIFLFLVFSLLSFQVIQFTASRGSFVILILLVSSVLFVYLLVLSNKYLKMVYLMAFVFGSVFFYSYLNNAMSDSILGKRFTQVGNEETTRQLHAKEAFKIGLNNPILGVGGGNYAVQPRDFERGSFSHNTYTECFANYGFPGSVCLLIFYLEFFSSISLKLINSRLYLFPLFIMMIFLCYNLFYVTYLTMDFMTIFVLNRLSLNIE